MTNPNTIISTQSPESTLFEAHDASSDRSETVLSPDMMGQLREAQYEAVAHATNKLTFGPEREQGINEFYTSKLPILNEAYLRAHHIDPQTTEGQSYLHLIDKYSVKNPYSPEGQLGDIWELNPHRTSDKQPIPSLKEQYTAEWNTIFHPQAETPNHEEGVSQELYEESETNYARIFARRMKGKVRRNARHEATKEVNKAAALRDRYAKILDEAHIQSLREQGKTEEELAEEMKLRLEIRAERRKELDAQELRKGRFNGLLDKYANLSRSKKVMIGLGTAAVLAGVGVGLFAAGGATAIVGGIGLGAVKVTKTYLQSRARLFEKQTDNDPELELVNEETGVPKTAEELMIEAEQLQNEGRRESIARADKIKKRAIGAAAIAGALILVGVGDHVVHAVDAASHVHADIDQGHSGAGHSSSSPTDTSKGGSHTHGSTSGSGTRTPEKVGPSSEALPSYININSETVTSGEGWYSTFSQMGITDPTQQANLLAKIGPQLQEHGWAYRMPGNSWGISRPGVLPKDVLNLIWNNR